MGPGWVAFVSRLPVGMSFLVEILPPQFRRMRTQRKVARKLVWQIAAQALQAMQCQVCYWQPSPVGCRHQEEVTPRGKRLQKLV